MKKLEIEHLAPYLPYQLKAIFNDEDIFVVLHLSLKYDQNPFPIIGWNMKEGNDSEMRDVFFEGCKPILRPLSDLTKEIEYDRKKIKVCDHLKVKINYGFAGFCPPDEKHIRNRIQSETLYYEDAKTMFKYHFDVFGLIDKNLAIDINKII